MRVLGRQADWDLPMRPNAAMLPVIAMLAGVAAGLVLARAIATRPLTQRASPVALGLVVAASIYVGFGLADGWWPHAAVQVLGGLPFVALAGARPKALGALGVGWIVHGAWDVAHGIGVVGTRIPPWYPWACAGVDLAVGWAAVVWARADGRHDGGPARAGCDT